MNDESIVGLSENIQDKLTVQKSIPLFALWSSDFSLSEFKILDVYLSRINSHSPEKKRISFEKGELERILCVKKINIIDLKQRIMRLMQPIILPKDEFSFDCVTLFERTECVQDITTGLWNITLECTDTAMQYFFNVDNIGYLRYKLRCIINLTSRYSYILFTYIESNRFRKTWEIDISELKHILSCENETAYKQYYRFNDLILKRCHKELTEKTECKFTYKPIKKGRAVVAINFTVETLSDASLGNNCSQQIIDIWHKDMLPTYDPDDKISFLQEACPEFNRKEMEEIFAILVSIPDYQLPNVSFMDNDIEFRRFHYLRELYTRLERISSNKIIKNRFLYFLKMLKTDTGR